jgi:hypothetical protein
MHSQLAYLPNGQGKFFHHARMTYTTNQPHSFECRDGSVVPIPEYHPHGISSEYLPAAYGFEPQECYYVPKVTPSKEYLYCEASSELWCCHFRVIYDQLLNN